MSQHVVEAKRSMSGASNNNNGPELSNKYPRSLFFYVLSVPEKNPIRTGRAITTPIGNTVLDVTTSKYFVSSVFGPSVFFALSLPHYHPKTSL